MHSNQFAYKSQTVRFFLQVPHFYREFIAANTKFKINRNSVLKTSWEGKCFFQSETPRTLVKYPWKLLGITYTTKCIIIGKIWKRKMYTYNIIYGNYIKYLLKIFLIVQIMFPLK